MLTRRLFVILFSIFSAYLSTPAHAQSEDSLALLRKAITELKRNPWLNTVRMEARISLNNTFKSTIQHPPDAHYPEYHNYQIQATIQRMGPYQYSRQRDWGDFPGTTPPETLSGKEKSFSYDIYDTKKNVSYDGGREVNFSLEFSSRHRIFDFLQLRQLGKNHVSGTFAEGLEQYAASVESGACNLTTEIQKDVWKMRFTLSDNPKEYAEIQFAPDKEFNVVKYIYNCPFRTIGYNEANYEYEFKDGTWLLRGLTFHGENDNMSRDYSVQVESIAVGKAAGLTEADFDWRSLPLPANAVIQDNRFPDPIVYDYSPGKQLVKALPTSEGLPEDGQRGKRVNPDNLLPQSTKTGIPEKPSRGGWLWYFLAFLAALAVLLGLKMKLSK